MADIEDQSILPKQVFPSTNWEYRKVKMSEPRQGPTRQRPQGTAPASKPRRKEFRRAQIVVTWKGGPEASYELKFNGSSWRYPGHLALHDVLTHFARWMMP